MQHIPFLIALLVFCITSLATQEQTCSVMSPRRAASLNGFFPFPADNPWNQDISSAPVDPNSSAIINFIGANTRLHPDFGAGLYAGQTIGIPYIVVSGSPLVKVKYTAYGSESDPGPMPVPKNAPIEGYPKAGTGAVWDLLNDEQRPYTWTSADAAGLPIFPGLARYDEVASGQIQHALRFTLQYSQTAFTPPASHWAGNSTNTYAAPMGMRIRRKSSFDLTPFPPQSRVILAALKKYGMITADNGGSMFISGDPDNRWNNNDLNALKQVP